MLIIKEKIETGRVINVSNMNAGEQVPKHQRKKKPDHVQGPVPGIQDTFTERRHPQCFSKRGGISLAYIP